MSFLLRTLISHIERRIARRRNYRTLRTLDQHILQDIGLTRADIAALR